MSSNQDIRVEASAGSFLRNMFAAIAVGTIAVILLLSAFDTSGYVEALHKQREDIPAGIMHLGSLGIYPLRDGNREAKLFNSAWYKPETVIVGRSNVWSNIDTLNPGLKQSDGRPGFNFGVAGVSIDEFAPILRHLEEDKTVKKVIFDLEFYMFNAERIANPVINIQGKKESIIDFPRSDERFATGHKFSLAATRLMTLKTTGDALFSLLAHLQNTIASGLSAIGNMINSVPARLKPPKAVRDALFLWLSNLQSSVATHLSRPEVAPVPVAEDRQTTLSAGRRALLSSVDRIQLRILYTPNFAFEAPGYGSAFDHLRAAIDETKRRDLELRIFLSPHHARTYEILHALGRWPAYEEWLRQLTNIIAGYNKGRPCQKHIVLLDFPAYSAITTDMTEAGKNDYGVYKYFGDSFHYRTQLGTMLIDSVTSYDACAPTSSDTAVPLLPHTIDAHIAAINQRRADFIRAHPDVPEETEALVSQSFK